MVVKYLDAVFNPEQVSHFEKNISRGNISRKNYYTLSVKMKNSDTLKIFFGECGERDGRRINEIQEKVAKIEAELIELVNAT